MVFDNPDILAQTMEPRKTEKNSALKLQQSLYDAQKVKKNGLNAVVSSFFIVHHISMPPPQPFSSKMFQQIQSPPLSMLFPLYFGLRLSVLEGTT